MTKENIELKEGIKGKIKEILDEYLSLEHYKVFYFGSRVTGEEDKRSDLDIGIEGNKQIPLAELYLIKEELNELPIFQKIDVVDFCGANEDFKEIAKRRIEIIYEK